MRSSTFNWIAAVAVTVAVIAGGTLVGQNLAGFTAQPAPVQELSPMDDYGIRLQRAQRLRLTRQDDWFLRQAGNIGSQAATELGPMDDYGIRLSRQDH